MYACTSTETHFSVGQLLLVPSKSVDVVSLICSDFEKLCTNQLVTSKNNKLVDVKQLVQDEIICSPFNLRLNWYSFCMLTSARLCLIPLYTIDSVDIIDIVYLIIFMYP